jgi:hypothetical protein
LLRTVINSCSDAGQKLALNTISWRDQFSEASGLGNVEMAELVDMLGLPLTDKLGWMIEEGTDWSLVRPKIVAATEDQKATVRTDSWLETFTGISGLGNEEMADLVDLLSLPLETKLNWMIEEGTDWSLVQPRVAAAPEDQKTAVRTDSWRDKFSDISGLGNDEMAQLVDLLGMRLGEKLVWMFEEGCDWSLIRAKVEAAPQDERDEIATDVWRERLIAASGLGNEEMSDLVDLLGLPLDKKLEWMIAEGTDWSLVRPKIVAAPGDQKDTIKTDTWRQVY